MVGFRGGDMRRREFLRTSAQALAASWLASNAVALPRKFSANDTVTLGNTGIHTSRLAMGTGTIGYGGHSNQSNQGVSTLSALLQNGYDQGLRFFDLADAYGSH